MADQDRGNADGTAGGPAGGSMAGGEGGHVAGADAPNVVPFPRDWFGSVDDLVPIDLEPQSGSSAAAFWEGDAAVADDVAATRRQAEAGTGTSNGFDTGGAFDAGSRGTSGTASATSTVRGGRARGSRQPIGSRRGVAWKIVAVAILLAAVFGGAAFVLNRNDAPRRHAAAVQGQKHAAKPLTETVTAPVTVTATVPARTDVRKQRPKSPKRLHKTRPRTTIVDRTTAPIRPTPPSSDVVSTSEPPAGSSSKNQDSGSAQGAASTPSASSQSSGGGCAQSPDSGCLP
jgi:hypothetical protein